MFQKTTDMPDLQLAAIRGFQFYIYHLIIGNVLSQHTSSSILRSLAHNDKDS